MDIKLLNGILLKPVKGELIPVKEDLFIRDGIISDRKREERDTNVRKGEVEKEVVINCEGKIILPGLVNAHHHIYSTLSKGISCETPFVNFLGNLKQLWWKLDRVLNEEDMLLSTVISLEESLRCGVTTVFDHHISLGSIEGILSKMADVYTKYCMQGSLAFEVSDRNGSEIFTRSLTENRRFARENHAKVRAMMGLHASFTLSEESLAKIAETTDMPIHMHIAEDIYDEKDCYRNYKKNIIQRLMDFGLLRTNSLLVHGSNISEIEMKLLADKPVYLVQAVDSNLNNGLEVANLKQLNQYGLKCVPGTDGMHSNIMKSLKNSFLLNRYINRSADIGFAEFNSMLMAMYELKEAFGFDLGTRDGEKADIAVFDYQPKTPLNQENLLGHFIYGLTEARAQYVIKEEAIILDDYKLKVNPYKELKMEAARITSDLFQRFQNQEA